MNTLELIRDLENASRFCAMEATTARRDNIALAERYAKMSNTFHNAAEEAKALQQMCVEAITQRFAKPDIVRY